MSNYARLTYASTSTSQPSTIRQDLTDILYKARTHNFNHQLFGVLYYGNNYFFQCIEGPREQVDAIYRKLNKDTRHKDVLMLSYKDVKQVSFKHWNMKYVRLDEAVQQFFNQHQWEKFNPYSLKDGLIDEFVDMLLQHADMETGTTESVYWNDAKELERSAARYLPWVILLSVLIMALLYFYYMMPGQGGSGINLINKQ